MKLLRLFKEIKKKLFLRLYNIIVIENLIYLINRKEEEGLDV